MVRERATDETILSAVDYMTRQVGYPPTVRELCSALGYRSPGSIHQRLARLRDQGRLSYVDLHPRTLRVVRCRADGCDEPVAVDLDVCDEHDR